MAEPAEVTALLRHWQAGDASAFERLYSLVHGELSRVAHHCMNGEGASHTLQTSGVVSEVYLRMVGADLDVSDREHFFALAARMMRRILVDHARSKRRVKRGAGAAPLTLDESAIVDENSSEILVEVDEALLRLAEHDERMAQAVELVYFGGLSYDDAARALDVSRSTLYADLKFAKAWLKQAMSA